MTTPQDWAARAVDTLEGLWNRRDPRVVEERFSQDCIQHNPLLPNGAAAIRDLVVWLASVQQPIVTIQRAVTEGDLAAVHSHYSWTPTMELDGGRGSAVVDIFRFGLGGRVVEHWDVSHAIAETSLNSNTVLDGGGDPTAPTTREERATNKAVVARYYDILRSGDTAALAEVIAADCIQHNPRLPNGLQPILRLFEGVGRAELDVYRVLAQGDLVVTHYHFKNLKAAGVDVLRLRDGRIAEMWDVMQQLPSTTASGNDLFAQLS